MKCAALHGPGDVRVGEMPDPIPGRDESLVRITGVGLCGSDLHWFDEGAIGDAVISRPLVLGHEMAGVVVSGRLEGKTVALDPAVPCGRCRECHTGLEHLCAGMRFAGHGETDGALCELMAWPDRRMHVLPDGLDAVGGALLEPLGVVVHSTDLAHLRHGWTVAVVGCGPIGLMLVQLSSMMGCEVIAVEPLAHRRDAATTAGALRVLASQEESRDAGLDDMCDVAFEVSGTDDGLERASTLVRPGGRIVIVGIPESDSTTFRASHMRRKGLTLAMVRRMTADSFVRAIALVAGGKLEVSWLITHRFGLEASADAFALAARRDGLKVVVEP